MLRKLFILVFLFSLVQASDRLLYELLRSGQVYQLLFCRVSLVWNQGIAFGWLHASTQVQELILVMTISLICGWVITNLYYLPTYQTFNLFAWCLILAGGLSNLVHRATLGAIPDLLVCQKLPWFLVNLHFNVSDLAIIFGMIMLLVTPLKRMFR